MVRVGTTFSTVVVFFCLCDSMWREEGEEVDFDSVVSILDSSQLDQKNTRPSSGVRDEMGEPSENDRQFICIACQLPNV